MTGTFPQPVLLIGSDGMLGTAWCEVLDAMGVIYRCPTLQDFDLTDEQSIQRSVTDDIKLVINCAAYTAVDKAEEQEELATQINGEGVGNLAERCKKVGAKLLHYSTDYVFPGNADVPYLPLAKREPCNAYGRSKAVGEKLIEQTGCNYLILRTSWLYAPWANNFVITIAKLAKDRDELQVVKARIYPLVKGVPLVIFTGRGLGLFLPIEINSMKHLVHENMDGEEISKIFLMLIISFIF